MTLEHAFGVYPMVEEDGITQWICEFPDLQGCIGVGDTYDEAIREGMLNRIVWIETAQAMGREAPASTCLNRMQNPKADDSSVNSTFEAIRKARKAFEGIAEELGVTNEDDVQKLVDEIRYGEKGDN
jgi:predicted RNase H-like HicB family nuclease